MIPSSRKSNYLARFGIFLIMVALITGIPGPYGFGGDSIHASQNLEIQTWYDLDAVRDNLDGNHILMSDLDSTTAGYEELASPTANQGEGWEPIGFWSAPSSGCGGAPAIMLQIGLTGTFDGQGYEIRDLFINRPGEGEVGLFGLVDEGGIIRNVGVVNVTVTGGWIVGGLVGENHYGTVSNSYSSGNVTGEDHVGGLVGENSGIVSDSYSTGSVTGNDERVGGLVGGNNGHGVVSNSYSTGSVTGDFKVGGLVGSNSGTVSDSYSTGYVSGYGHVGGLVGENYGGVGDSFDSFWDIETSGQSTSDGGMGKNTTAMQDIATFSDAGWNIIPVAPGSTNTTYIWNIVNNVTYPFLSWQS